MVTVTDAAGAVAIVSVAATAAGAIVPSAVIVNVTAGAIVLNVVIVAVLASGNVAAAAAVVTNTVATPVEHCGWSCCCDCCIIWSPNAFII